MLQQTTCQRRIIWLLLIIGLCSIVLLCRLFYIQVLQGPQLSRGATGQRGQGMVLLDGRGDIQDRNGNTLIDSRNTLGLLAFPGQYRGYEEDIIEALSTVQGIERVAQPPHGMFPFWITSSLDPADISSVLSLPGLLPVTRTQRYGPYSLASHLVGYLRESEARGVSGIELAFDHELSLGQRTVLWAVVDGYNRLIPGLGYRVLTDRVTSQNVVLTIDRELQREVERIVDTLINRGAVVVMDPHNGDILAMVSRPDFDAANLAGYLQGESLLNRALSAYQPGSVFKTVVAAAALQEGIASLFDTFYCPGGITVEGLYIPCSNLHRKEEITLVEAFAYSCNTAFIGLALELGPEAIHSYAARLGFGSPTGVPIGEKAGNLPGVKENARPRSQANTAIGQGDVLANPLQVAVMMSVVANGGQLVQPRLVLALRDGYGRDVRRFLPDRDGMVLEPATVNKLKYLLQAVMDEGTGRPANTTEALTGAKTGTAQSGRRLPNGREILNYWIAGLYPLENTEAVIVVFADDLKPGGTVARVFGEITRYLE